MWDTLSEGEQLYARKGEVFAGYASYTDAQLGRLLDYLEQTGQFDNTIVVAMSDNGSSAEGGSQGSVNANRWYYQIPESLDENLSKRGELGSETTYPHCGNGWAMAFNTPFKLHKMNAPWEGGTADPLLISWPAGLSARGVTCDKYVR